MPISIHTTPGRYLLLLHARHRVEHERFDLPAGWYSYAGSAESGLEQRIARHLRTRERRHWNIDVLLSQAEMRDIQILTGTQRRECELMQISMSWAGARRIRDFGSADCRCEGHLVHFPSRPFGSVHAEIPLVALDRIMNRLHQSYVDHAAFQRDPFETLVKCLLSLRTQDPVTDAAAERLFQRFRTPDAFAEANPDEIATLIFPVGMYRRKSRNLIEVGKAVRDRFSGATPGEIDDLLTIPGVGRKTANLVRSFAFHLPAICVDTHVHRITNRWGLVRTSQPNETEEELRRILPEHHWTPFNALLVQHGQRICRPIRPKCAECSIGKWCGYAVLADEDRVLSSIAGAPRHPSLKFLGTPTTVTGSLSRS